MICVQAFIWHFVRNGAVVKPVRKVGTIFSKAGKDEQGEEHLLIGMV
jgi:hypothetical protein